MKYIIVFLVSILYTNLYSQNPCGTPDPESLISFSTKDIQNEIAHLKNTNRNDPRVFMLSIHIIKSNTGGNGIKKSFVNAALATLNEHYQPLNIEFQVCDEFFEINNSKYLETDPDEGLELTLLNNVENTINIYFIPDVVNSSGDGICGNATFPTTSKDRRRIFMDNGCATNGSTLSHEMGHYFNLLHTHSSFYGEERVARIGCSTSGDGFCDTPADPRLSSSEVDNCIYVGNEFDPYGDTYMPDASNLMSYAPKACRKTFTDEQMAMVSLTAAGSNDYHIETCSNPDFEVNSDYGDGIVFNNFEDLDVNFNVSSPSLYESVSIEYNVSLINSNQNIAEELQNGILDFTEKDQVISVHQIIPFSSKLLNYDRIVISIDNNNLIDEANEGNNNSTVELSYDYFPNTNQIIFPNPSYDNFTLYRSDNYIGFLDCHIFDMSGAKLRSKSIEKTTKNFFHEFDIDGFLPGSYILQIFDDSDDYEIVKFVRL